MYEKYADLLLDYSINVQKGQQILIRSTTIAEPLLKALYKGIISRGAFCETLLSIEDQDRYFFSLADETQLKSISPFYEMAVDTFDAIISIMAPHNLKSTASIDPSKKRVQQEAMAPIRKRFMKRSAKKDLRWVLAVFPTQSAAQESGLSLDEYQDFVYKACKLDQDHPRQAWEALSNEQEKIVTRLNQANEIRFTGYKTDIRSSVKGRHWINSDGHYNMPSGEVFSAPVEDAVNGEIFFDVPTVYNGTDVSGIYLKVKDGLITDWSAELGQAVLDQVFQVDGARCFGEIAIATNYSIQTPTKNILFDEKMGGSIHMAVGASYPECGGKNESAIHWDMIKWMKEDSRIYADSILIYENGQFLI